MDLLELRNNIVNNKYRKSYLFTGIETGIMEYYVQTIAKKNSLEVSRVDSYNEISKELVQKPLIGNHKLYYVYNDKDITSNEQLANSLLEDNFIKYNMVIFRYTEIDKRKKFFKTLEDITISFGKLSVDVLYKYMKNKVKSLDKHTANIICDLCDFDYSRIMNELDKISILINEYNVKIEDLPKIIQKHNLIYKKPQDVIFNLIDSVVSFDMTNAFRLLQESYDSGEHPLVILSLLFTRYRDLLALKGVENGKNASNETGINYYVVNNLWPISKQYKVSEITYILKNIYDYQNKIKQGKVDPYIAVNYIINLIGVL